MTAPTVAPEWLTTTDDPGKVAEFFAELVTDTFEQENTRRQEGRVATRLTMSGIGGCTRACAYAVAGTPASDVHPPEEARQALLGTGAHDWFLPAMARTLGGDRVEVEKPVVLRAAGLTIHGTLDLALPGVVVDLKTVREFKLSGVRRHGAYAVHRGQVFGYALAQYQAGREVRWVVYLYMDRTTGEVEVVVERFTNDSAMAVIRRIETIKRFATTDPEIAPREARGPGLSLVCDRCPWLRRCWGPDARPGDPSAVVTVAGDYDGLLHTLALYAEAAEVAGAAKRDQEFAKLVLSQTKGGTYGPWRLTRGAAGEMEDVEEMRRILARHGYEVPKKPKAGQTRVSAAKPPKPAAKPRKKKETTS